MSTNSGCLAADPCCSCCCCHLQALSNTLWALATLQYVPDEAWRQAYSARLGEQLPHFTRTHLMASIWAVNVLRWEDLLPQWGQLQQQAQEAGVLKIGIRSLRMNSRALRVMKNMGAGAGAGEEQHQQQRQ